MTFEQRREDCDGCSSDGAHRASGARLRLRRPRLPRLGGGPDLVGVADATWLGLTQKAGARVHDHNATEPSWRVGWT